MSINTLSILIPCFNEADTLENIVKRVQEADSSGLTKEIIIVDDGSADGSVPLAKRLAESDGRVRVFCHEKNLGKGAAVRTGIKNAQGELILIQDADLEYNPGEYPKLLAPLLNSQADVVYGSRFKGGDSSRVLFFWHSIGNKILTLLSNMMTDLNLTDMETCYKVFRSEILKRIILKENRFGFEPEVTAKISRISPKPRIYEVGISYMGRTYQEGKKIGWKDGLKALYCIFRYNLFPGKLT